MNIESVYCTPEMNMFYQLYFNLKRERERLTAFLSQQACTEERPFEVTMRWGNPNQGRKFLLAP